MNERVGGCELDPHNDLFNNVFSIGKGLNTSFEMNFVDNWFDASKIDDNLLVKFVLLSNFKWKTKTIPMEFTT